MTDLRELLYEPWCEKCGIPSCDRRHTYTDKSPSRPPLATRMPEAVPAGLEWNSRFNYWCIRHQTVTGPSDRPLVFGETMCSPDHAELLFIGNAVKLIDIGADIVVAGKGELADRLAAALHRLADERDAAK